MLIDSSNISVIVQGKIYGEYTTKCLASIRYYLPRAEIILSTWEGDDIEGLDYDVLVLTPDIGGGSIDSLGIVNNINRQLVSTKSGLKKANRKYIFKFRSDMCLASNKFLQVYDSYEDGSTIFKHRLLICDYYTRNPRVIPMPFHLSDWVLFGYNEDVKHYYDFVPLQTDEDDEWFLNHENEHGFFKAIITRYAPEQHFCINFFAHYYPLNCKDYADNSLENICLTEKLIAENFVVVDSKKDGIIFQKYSPNRFQEKASIISFKDWLAIYNFYINGKPLCLYKIKCFAKHFIYFYLRRFLSRTMDILGIKNTLRKMIG